MNLRVDLIQEAERRSARPVSLAFIIRISAFSLLAFGILGILLMINSISKNNRDLQYTETELKRVEPKYNAFVTLTNGLTHQKAILMECQGWERSRMEWHKAMVAFQRLVPERIQMRDIRVSHELKPDGRKTVRTFTLVMKGRATSLQADSDVAKLKNDLAQAEVFVPVLINKVVDKVDKDGVEMLNYNYDSAKEGGRADRIFDIRCNFKPRYFEE